MCDLKRSNCTNTVITHFVHAVSRGSAPERFGRWGQGFKSRSDNKLVLFSVVPGSHSSVRLVNSQLARLLLVLAMVSVTVKDGNVRNAT